ncbi:hypothetical protein QOZ95_003527 [Paenibacillus brasilensis]|uniref:Uncharacterized protein n=1 Tax=Paenibacillus brasilensis TaxID=128574 RepID=A0ABU0L0X9_9BACL|nr:hypothetical protein [Paenibacillus brasilensis]
MGAQLIGEALGAKHEHSPEKEIGCHLEFNHELVELLIGNSEAELSEHSNHRFISQNKMSLLFLIIILTYTYIIFKGET